MHKSQINRAIQHIVSLLMDYGITEVKSKDRAKSIASIGEKGERITPSIVNKILTPTELIAGIPDDRTRHKVSIEVARHWAANTSNTTTSAWMKLHSNLGMTRSGAAKWLHRTGYIGTELKDSLQSSGSRFAKHRRDSLQHSVQELKKSLQKLKIDNIGVE